MAERPADPLSTLQHVLASAARIAQDMADDPLLPRLIDVFSRMPVEDRETILMALEREVDLRNLSREAPSAPFSGINVSRPNPNARLYLRVTDGDPPPYISPEEIVQAVTRAARMVHRAGARNSKDHFGTWAPAMVEGLRRVDRAERETLRWYHRTLLELLDAADRDK